MEFGLVAIALGDLTWLFVAFSAGLLARAIGLPPLVGFLCAGFLLKTQGVVSSDVLNKLADLGITLLLFTVGLKLNLGTLLRPQVWGVSLIHTSVVIVVFAALFKALAFLGLPYFAGLSIEQAGLIAFALSFSSTVFVAKVLEEKGEMSSLHGRISIGVLIVQDLVAVVFLAFSAGKMPSIWALSLLLLIPFRPLLMLLLNKVGRGELLVLYGFILALGGANVFELVGVKGDLGALVFGIMIGSHSRADEMAKTMLGFKDLFLLGFFLSIGLSQELSMSAVAMGAALLPLVLLKTLLFFVLFIMFNLRSRTSLLGSLSLGNYSEFGLIVIAVSVSNGWLAADWLLILAIALAFSLVLASGFNIVAHAAYQRYREYWKGFQRAKRMRDDSAYDMRGIEVLIIGMGGVGSGAYDVHMKELASDKDENSLLGIDIDPVTARNQRDKGRNVLLGDPSDPDFWDRVQEAYTVKLILLALPKHDAIVEVVEQLQDIKFDGKIAATVRFEDEQEHLEELGVQHIYNIYEEAGAGFARHVNAELKV